MAMIPHPRAAGDRLAPGYRFKPTDEELVSYYLKRKVSGLPILMDSIAEIDLYKLEPWDLPSFSRLRTRDLEWFFFTPLDRKYASRSRTNRATAQGYWKTTGKDRPVHHRGSVVGMKKTLVFHHGRAPRGQRTNWVMHEYRLEDPSAASSSSSSAALAIPQGSYVVCRIFQKPGAGPQNGVQYGAPVIEEGDEEAAGLVPESEGALAMPVYAAGAQDMNSDEVEQQLMGIQHEPLPALKEDSEEQDGGSHANGSIIALEDILDLDTFFEEPVNGAYMSENMVEGVYREEESQSPQVDSYMELRDICGSANGDTIENGSNETTPCSQVDANTFEVANDADSTQELSHIYLPGHDVLGMQSAAFSFPGEQTEDNVFYDAPNMLDTIPPYVGYLYNANDNQFDMGGDDLEALMAYFAATENSLGYNCPDSAESSEFVYSATNAQPNLAVKAEGSSSLQATATALAPATSGEMGSPSIQSQNMEADNSVTPDAEDSSGWNGALKRRAMGILSSISAPPAKAEGSLKGKAAELLSAAQASSSVQVLAQLIHVPDVSLTERAGQWTLQKKGDLSFVLCYGVDANGVRKSAVCFEPVPKVQGGSLALLLRGAICLIGVSGLILCASLKLGMSIYGK